MKALEQKRENKDQYGDRRQEECYKILNDGKVRTKRTF